jgi:hypothetical protein
VVKLEEAYQLACPSNLERAGKPFRLLLYHPTDQTAHSVIGPSVLVAVIRDTPAYQCFTGLPEYQLQAPSSFSALSYFKCWIALLSELITNIIGDFVRDCLQVKLGHKKILLTDATAILVKIKYP